MLLSTLMETACVCSVRSSDCDNKINKRRINEHIDICQQLHMPLGLFLLFKEMT